MPLVAAVAPLLVELPVLVLSVSVETVVLEVLPELLVLLTGAVAVAVVVALATEALAAPVSSSSSSINS